MKINLLHTDKMPYCKEIELYLFIVKRKIKPFKFPLVRELTLCADSSTSQVSVH